MDPGVAARLRAAFDDEGSRTIEAVAETAGVDLAELIAARRALGLATEVSAPQYGAAADEHARHLAVALAAGIPMETLLELDRVVARTTTAVLAAAQDSVIGLVGHESTGGDTVDRDADVAALVTELAPEVEWLLAYSFRQHAAELLRRETGAVLVFRSATRSREMAVGFADLVGFTDLGARNGPEALNAVAHHLELLATDAARAPVSVVKFLGDAVMLVSPDAASLIESLLHLLEAAGAHPGVPELRAGVAQGAMISRAGDWYGSPVNLASRLTALAPPGHLAATDDTAACAPTVCWGKAEIERVRGFAEPVTVRLAPGSRSGSRSFDTT